MPSVDEKLKLLMDHGSEPAAEAAALLAQVLEAQKIYEREKRGRLDEAKKERLRRLYRAIVEARRLAARDELGYGTDRAAMDAFRDAAHRAARLAAEVNR